MLSVVEVENVLRSMVSDTGSSPTLRMFCARIGVPKSTFNKQLGSYTDMLHRIGAPSRKSFTPIERSCACCKGVFYTSYKRDPKTFCSVQCSNRDRKVSIDKTCKGCGVLVTKCAEYCSPICQIEYRFKNTLLIDAYCEGPRANRYRAVRGSARNYAKYILGKVCVNCGYDKHVEVAHIRPIRDFPVDSTLWDVNNPCNITVLCPNCHWEHDRGRLVIPNATSLSLLNLGFN